MALEKLDCLNLQISKHSDLTDLTSFLDAYLLVLLWLIYICDAILYQSFRLYSTFRQKTLLLKLELFGSGVEAVIFFQDMRTTDGSRCSVLVIDNLFLCLANS